MKLRRALCLVMTAIMAVCLPMSALAQEAMPEEVIGNTESSEETIDATISEDNTQDGIKLVYDAGSVVVTLTASDDAFDNKGELSLSVKEVISEDAVKEVNAIETENVAKRITYDITVLDDGEEIEPLEDVKVEFALKNTPSGVDGVNIYHHDEKDGIEKIASQQLHEGTINSSANIAGSAVDNAEIDEALLEDIQDEEVFDDVTVDTVVDSFSLYTVDFTYNDKTISIAGNSTENKLQDVAKQLGINAQITDAITYQDVKFKDEVVSGNVKNEEGDTLFSVYEKNNTWYVDAVNAFDTEHGLVIKTSDGAEYKIKVTDAIDDINNYITFSSLEDFNIQTNKGWSGTIYYSVNHSDWYTWEGNNISASPSNGKYYLYFRGENDSKISGDYDYRWIIEGNGEVDCTGNIMTLLNYNNPNTANMADYCFKSMFDGCVLLASAPQLPAMNLSSECYLSMFYGCSKLAKAPDLPATELKDDCYNSMFGECTSLTKIPVLPATTLKKDCYFAMFSMCSNIKLYTEGYGQTWSIPSTAVEPLTDEWGQYMFANTGGTFTGTPVPGTIYYTSNVPPKAEEAKVANVSSAGVWTSVPTMLGSEAAPLTGGTWTFVNGVWKYIYNNDTLKNARAWIQYPTADGKIHKECFYFNKYGTMQTGWHLIDGNWYCHDENGAMYRNTTTPDGYTIGSNGAWIK